MSNSSSFGYSRSLEGKPKLFGEKIEIHLALGARACTIEYDLQIFHTILILCVLKMVF